MVHSGMSSKLGGADGPDRRKVDLERVFIAEEVAFHQETGVSDVLILSLRSEELSNSATEVQRLTAGLFPSKRLFAKSAVRG